jgi:hypothetical protein
MSAKRPAIAKRLVLAGVLTVSLMAAIPGVLALASNRLPAAGNPQAAGNAPMARASTASPPAVRPGQSQSARPVNQPRAGTAPTAGVTSPAAAQSRTLTVIGGSAAMVSAPGVAGGLLKAGIVPTALPPAQLSINFSNLTANILLPAAGGTVTLPSLNGTVQLGGALVFSKLFPPRAVQLTNMQVTIFSQQINLTALTFAGTRITLFHLDQARAIVGGDAAHLSLSNLTTILTAEGAQFLDASLHTNVFIPGALFGTASSNFQHV